MSLTLNSVMHGRHFHCTHDIFSLQHIPMRVSVKLKAEEAERCFVDVDPDMTVGELVERFGHFILV